MIETLGQVLNYDQTHGIESDAYADYESEQRFEHGGDYGSPSRFSIGVYLSLQDAPRYIDSREARVLAATLLKAADAADAGLMEIP